MSGTKNTSSISWQTELGAKAFKYHVLSAWVAIVLDPLWVIGDYFNSPAHFTDFFIFRLAVALATFIGVLFKNKLAESPEIIALIPFLGISIQNAYMYSVMNIEEFQKHTFAYIALFIGAGMFFLWKPIYSILVVLISLVANIIFFSIFSQLTIDEALINGGMLTFTVALFTILLIQTRMNLTKKEIIARLALAESNKLLGEKNEIIEQKSKDILDSINYAQRIQQAILPSFEKIDKVLADYFILYKPKDVVSGDFYWLANSKTTPQENKPSEEFVIIAAVDCTGHGVPGALMSIIGNTILNQTTTTAAVNSPAEALDFLNAEISKNLKSIRDGMDIALCAINFNKMELQFAGANNPIYILRNDQFIEIKADKQAIGSDLDSEHSKTFTNHVFNLQKGDIIYLFTDGYADQFGGPGGKKFKYKKFRDLLSDMQQMSMTEQKQVLDLEFEEWRGDLEQVDDVLVIGVRV